MVAGLLAPSSGAIGLGSGARAVVFQEAFLFDGTIRDNIRVGVPLDDDDALAAAIRALYDAPAERRRRGLAGRARVESAFRRDRMLAETLAIYREVAA